MPIIKLKHLNVLSVAKIGAIVGLIFGLIYGIILALVVWSLGPIAGAVVSMAGLGAGLIFVSSIIIGLLAGFIGGALYAFFYNVASGLVGPIEMELED
jgi:uncharacterized membrane protein YGL010W